MKAYLDIIISRFFLLNKYEKRMIRIFFTLSARAHKSGKMLRGVRDDLRV